MQKFHRSITLERFDKFTSSTYFKDVNLYSRLYKKRTGATTTLEAYSVPNLQRITFEEAVKGEYKPAKVGDSFGPAWATVWFRVRTEIPADWVGEEVQFLWDGDNEGMIWTVDGMPLQGLTGGSGWDRRAEYVLTRNSKGGETFEFYIEMACNGMFGNGLDGQINPPDSNRHYPLKTAEVAAIDKKAFQLWFDFQIVAGMAKELPSDSQRGCQAVVAANAMVNAFMTDDERTYTKASEIAREFLAQYKGDASHVVTAVGHCHIDTAWLWPYDETKRKCARSWATQIDLMKRYPGYKFACSSAQQFEWMEQNYPKLFREIQVYVKKGQFLPVGGTWVEMDANIPSGEGFVRQFLYGQRYIQKAFGMKPSVFWLPDTFGYAGQLPQIIKMSGMQYFLTQKLSWNNINKFPNTTFYWSGLDGTKVLTHFPPADTYCAQADVREVLFGVKNHKDKEYSNESMMLFGHGDGGGGPTFSMLERLERMKGVNGLPEVRYGDPTEFFKRVERTSKDLVSWHGELVYSIILCLIFLDY